MKNKRTTLGMFLPTIVLGVVAASVVWLPTSVKAYHEVDGKLHTGMFGLAPFQTARLNLVNVIDPSDPSQSLRCDVEMSFFDDRGNRLSQLRVQLRPGEAAVLDLPHSAVGRSGRAPIRAELVGFNPQPDPPGSRFAPCVATAEVFDNRTGITSMFLGGPDTVPDPVQ